MSFDSFLGGGGSGGDALQNFLQEAFAIGPAADPVADPILAQIFGVPGVTIEEVQQAAKAETDAITQTEADNKARLDARPSIDDLAHLNTQLPAVTGGTSTDAIFPPTLTSIADFKPDPNAVGPQPLGELGISNVFTDATKVFYDTLRKLAAGGTPGGGAGSGLVGAGSGSTIIGEGAGPKTFTAKVPFLSATGENDITGVPSNIADMFGITG